MLGHGLDLYIWKLVFLQQNWQLLLLLRSVWLQHLLFPLHSFPFMPSIDSVIPDAAAGHAQSVFTSSRQLLPLFAFVSPSRLTLCPYWGACDLGICHNHAIQALLVPPKTKTSASLRRHLYQASWQRMRTRFLFPLLHDLDQRSLVLCVGLRIYRKRIHINRCNLSSIRRLVL